MCERHDLNTLILVILLAGCAPSAAPTAVPTVPFINTPSPTASPTFLPDPTETPTLVLSPTQKPLTLLFYGDSVLKVGDVSRQGEVGYLDY